MVRLLFIVTACFALVTVSASSRPGAEAQGHRPLHLATDWSHRHIVFSAPGSMEQTVRLQNEPRYWHQWFRRYARTVQAANSHATGWERVFREEEDNDNEDHRGHPRPRGTTDPLHRDWGMSLGAGATGGDEMYPAKFTFDVNATPSCANDFVVFNTGVAGGVPTAASRTGTFNATTQPAVGNTVTITSGLNVETLTATAATVAATGTATIATVPNAGDTVTIGGTTYTFDAAATGTVTITAVPAANDTVTIGTTIYTFVTSLSAANQVLIVAGSTTNTAQNLRAAIDASTGQCFTGPPCFGTGTGANASVTATRASNVVTVTAITGGTAGNTIPLATTGSGSIAVSGATLSGGTGNFSNPNEVLIVAGSTNNSAQNLRAAIGASSVQCSVSPCFGTGTTANASVTATISGSVVTVTAITAGAGGNSIVFTTTGNPRITLLPNTGTLGGGITGGSNAGTSFQIGSTTTVTATNLAAAIARSAAGASVPVTATSGGRIVTVTATTAGSAGNSISVATNISSASFAWGGPTLAGGADAPGTIIGFNNLYSTQNGVTPAGLCGSTGPTVLFSYNTDVGTNGTGTTTGATHSSPVLSGDGSKIAFMESGDSGGAILRLLRWDADGPTVPPSAPDQVVAEPGAAWTSCNPPPNSCMIGLRLGNAAQDGESAPFYVYSKDTLYVGDDSGKLHKFINVFGISGATPSEVTTAGWPVTVSGAGNHLHSPIYDGTSANIFIGDLLGNAYYVKEAGSSVGVCSSSSNGGVAPCLGTTDGTAGGATSIALGGVIDDAPIVDSTTERVFFFDGSVNSTTCAAAGTNAALVQLDTQLTSSTQVKVCFPNSGTANQLSNMKSGAFDNAYVSSAMGSKAGKLYFCARSTGFRDHPSLFRIGFNTSGVMSSTADTGFLDLVTTSGEECSPLTEIYNPNGTATDWLFVSVGNNAALGTTCSATNAGCLMSFNLTTLGATWPPAGATGSYNLPADGATPGGGGSSGIIVDNVSNAVQASSIYFTFLTNASANATCNGNVTSGCAVKLTQAGLN